MAHPIRTSVYPAPPQSAATLVWPSRSARWLAQTSLLTVAISSMGSAAFAQDIAPPPTGPQAIAGAEDAYRIQFRADTLVVAPVLDAALTDTERTVVAGDEAHFLAYSNYPAFITGGEIRVFRNGASPDGEPLARVKVAENGIAT